MHCIRRLVRELLSFLILVDIQAKGMAVTAFHTDARVEGGYTLGIGSLNP